MEAEAGDVITVSPDEMHDGAPIGGLRGWRMVYLDPALVARELAEEREDRPEIARPALRDPVLTGLFARLFVRVTAAVLEPLALEEEPAADAGSPPAVALARQRLDEAPGGAGLRRHLGRDGFSAPNRTTCCRRRSNDGRLNHRRGRHRHGRVLEPAAPGGAWRRLAAWAGVAPGNYESAGKPKGAGTRRGNVFFKSAPFAAASVVVRTEGSYYRDKYNRLHARRGPVREIMAITHKLLIAAFHMLSTGEAVRDLGERYFDQVACKRSTAKLVQRLNNLGYDIMLARKVT